MIQLTQDPSNPSRLVLTQTTVLYLDKLTSDVLSDEVALSIRAQAQKDLAGNKAVKKAIAEAATKLLLKTLGCPEEPVQTDGQ